MDDIDIQIDIDTYTQKVADIMAIFPWILQQLSPKDKDVFLYNCAI